MTGTDGLTTATPRWLSKIVDLAVWGSIVIVTTLFGLMVMSFVFSSFIDACDEWGESPRNVGGWSIALGSVVVTAVLGWLLRRHIHWIALTLGIASQASVFWIVLKPVSC